MNEIYLIRHGETDANRNYIVQGRMDNPLNEYGKDQAMKTGIYLAKQKIKFDLVLSSPLKRAFETARLINSGMKMSKPIIVHQDLIERNFGDYDGQKITDEYTDLIRRGTIPHMEQNDVLEERIFRTIKEIRKKYPNKKLWIVTHSHVIKAVLTKLVPGFDYTSYLFNCSINHLLFKQGKLTVLEHNINPFEDRKL